MVFLCCYGVVQNFVLYLAEGNFFKDICTEGPVEESSLHVIGLVGFVATKSFIQVQLNIVLEEGISNINTIRLGLLFDAEDCYEKIMVGWLLRRESDCAV